MKTRLYLAVLAASCFSVFPAAAQQVTGTPGSPSATSTIDGQSLPAAPPAFGGTINLDAQQSTPWWPPSVVPPKGAPNVLLIITDDAGYGVSGTFGGVIPTPTLDAVAAAGLRYTQFHSTALCSPTRAALITGRNHHSSGFGVIAEQATGFPGYDTIIGPNNATIGNILKNHGYATSWFGKNHNTPTNAYSTSGPFDQWPSGMGFDYFYGFMGGESNQWVPWLFRNHTQISPWNENPKYNLITGMADDAINYLRETNAATPEKPFFLYYAPGATHAPHHPTEEWIKKFEGKFDMGWNAMRDQIFANQKRLGVIPENAKLTPWPDDLPQWDTLSADEKKMFARQAEVFAAYVAYADNEIGRVIDEVRKQGKLDNTLIIYIEGDNGTSAEGSTIGTAFDLAAIQGINMPVADQLKYYDAWGSDVTTPHMSVAWSWAFDTPFKWTKQIASHFGGTRQGIAMSWPGHITDTGGVRSQFHHVIDIVPTILEATGIQAPQTVNGIAQKPIEGVSMAYTWSKGAKDVPSARQTQYFEMFGDRAIYHDGWIASTTPPAGPWLLGLGKLPNVLDGYNWELYDITKDFSQFDDVAAKEPAKLKELQELFLVEAAKYQVFPLDNSVATRFIAPRPSATAGRDTFTYTGTLSGLPPSSAPSPLTRSYTITAEIEVPEGGGEGMINTLGGRFGGYGLYLLKGKPIFTYNMMGLERFRWEGADALASGKHTVVFDFTYDGPGFGKGGTGVLSVDGAEIAKQTIPHTIPFLATIDESFDVGIDTRLPIDDKDYQVPFPFTGTLDKLTVKVGPTQL
ncbi:arylsulfatase [Rhizobium sp. BK251]|uniref:arylsulfatase n=1 Tax=Rhizobium sp. BK251 TaxID=2512125 RepID=UPI00104973AD|nr:arylsulfatase [Rhizobium sp. BK251]TCL70433.1 arylsulfatase [Rhizobium sp. BK251]